MTDENLVRECVLASLKMQTTFRQTIQRSLKRHRIDLTFEMLQLMFRLWTREGINQQELANQTCKDKVSLSYLINNLEKKGLVSRTTDPADRRNKLIYLTPEGTELRGTVYPLLTRLYAEAGEQLQETHLQDTLRYLQEMNETFQAL